MSIKNKEIQVAFTILFTFIFYGCITENSWKTIDTGTFSIKLPSNFKYVEGDGIDSHVGSFENNDSIKIFFDYGFYTDISPLTDEEFFERQYMRTFMRTDILQKFALVDTIPKEELTNKIKIVRIKELDNKLVNTDDTIPFTHVATLKYSDKTIDFPFIAWYDSEDNRLNYNFEFDSIDGWQRKIFYPKNKDVKRSGVVLKGKFNKSIGNYVALALSIYGVENKEKDFSMAILKSVRIKKR